MPNSSGREDNEDRKFLDGSSNMANNDGRKQLPIMVRPSKKSHKPIWPFMELWGLCRKAIDADGNCLFRALSDQLYDTTDKHGEVRQKVVDYLRTNRADFEPFVPIDTGDWVRSQASTRSSRSRKVSVDDDHYEAYLENMARPKTWGGEIEIRAFCEAFDTDVIIHRPTDAGNPFDQMVNNKRVEGQPRHFAHVSFGGEQSHPHYESVRPIKPSETAAATAQNVGSKITKSLCQPAGKALPLAGYSTEPLNIIQQARPTVSAEELHTFLECSRIHLDTIFAQVINTDRERSSSTSSASQRSSSSKRSREDDDEESDRASKRALRRISLRNKTSAFVTSIVPPSSPHGTEICFNIRIDTPPGTPTESGASQKGAAEEGEKGTERAKKPNEERSKVAERAEEKVPSTTGKSPKEDVEDSAALAGKAQRGMGGKRARVKNPGGT